MDGRTARAVLGVAEHASSDDVRAAFRRQVAASHPDRGGAPEQFRTVVDAFSALRTGLPPRSAPAAPLALADRHGFCAYDSPRPARRPATRSFDDYLAAALDRELAGRRH
jgi:DnaJ domain